ncbi:hypothetical protein WOLCODRAFT_34841, partial [Wolfiporia cocos MD-104 SS10]
YVGRDYPQSWQLPPLGPVLMAREPSVHYALDTPIAIREWNATLPSGGALLHLGPSFRQFTLSMFHQLRCLNIIREALVSLRVDPDTRKEELNLELARHCMHYLRQMVLCRADTRLEAARSAKGQGVTVWDVTHECRDWSVVYDAAEENLAEYI